MATTTTSTKINYGGANSSPREYSEQQHHHHTADDTTEWEAVSSSLLDAARPFLRGELGSADDPELPSLVSVLRAAGAGECYHKHGTFLAHLLDVYRILRLWGASHAVARCGLFHSSYSNSFVDLAIFHPDTGHRRRRRRAPRPPLLRRPQAPPHIRAARRQVHGPGAQGPHLAAAEAELRDANQQAVKGGLLLSMSPWRRKLRSVVPPEGVVAAHIRTGEPVPLSRRVVAAFLLMTVADFSDQYTDYQDELFENGDGRLDRVPRRPLGRAVAGHRQAGALGQRHVEAGGALRPHRQGRAADGRHGIGARPPPPPYRNDDDMAVGELVIPPVLERCSRVLDPGEQKAARDLYWEAITSSKEQDTAEALLRESIGRNPLVGEPYLVLAQVLLNGGRYAEAEAAAGRGVRLLLEWGSSWDKRMSWEGWVSWGRLMGDKARRATWPRTAWGIINLGLVQGVANRN